MVLRILYLRVTKYDYYRLSLGESDVMQLRENSNRIEYGLGILNSRIKTENGLDFQMSAHIISLVYERCQSGKPLENQNIYIFSQPLWYRLGTRVNRYYCRTSLVLTGMALLFVRKGLMSMPPRRVNRALTVRVSGRQRVKISMKMVSTQFS